MTAPFASAQARINSAVMRVLANTTVSIAGAPAVNADFDDGFAHAGLGSIGIDARRPTLTVATSSVPQNLDAWLADPGNERNSPYLDIVVDGGAYRIVAHQKDGGGLSHLVLESA